MPSILERLHIREQAKALVGDHLYSMFNGGIVKQPRELSTYRKYYEDDSTVGTSIDALSNMTCGNGIYPTVKEPDLKVGDWTQQEALDEINDLNERIRLDEALLNVNKCMRIYGYSPVERVTRRGPPGGILELMVLEPESCEYKRLKNTVTGFTQKIQSGNPIPFAPDELIWFTNKQVGNAKGALYGQSDVKRVLRLLEIRDATIENINGILKNQARPPVIWKTKNAGDTATLKVLLKEAMDAGEDLVIHPKDSVENEVVKIDTRIPYWEYVAYIDGLIFQGLHSPMLDYLRNATQASADTMLKVIQLDVEGSQRYLKRMVEHEIWEWHLRKKEYEGEIPSCNFGAPKTGLEDLKIDTFLTKGLDLSFIDRTQFNAILKAKGLTLPEPEKQPETSAMQPQNGAGQITVNTIEPTDGNLEAKQYDTFIVKKQRNT
jgi:hypothetical protein